MPIPTIESPRKQNHHATFKQTRRDSGEKKRNPFNREEEKKEGRG